MGECHQLALVRVGCQPVAEEPAEHLGIPLSDRVHSSSDGSGCRIYDTIVDVQGEIPEVSAASYLKEVGGV